MVQKPRRRHPKHSKGEKKGCGGVGTMDTNLENGEINREAIEAQIAPLLETVPKPPKTAGQKAIRKTFKGTAHLAKLLPTGSVLTFQLLSPIFTHQGQCRTIVSQFMTTTLLLFCGLSCFFLCFTDSFRDERGKVRYGLATPRGMRVIDGSVTLPAGEAARYRLRGIDFVHAFMSVLVFGAVVMFNDNVVKCLCPNPSEEAEEVLVMLPVGVGAVCSLLFLAFPTQRHGIGFPLSKD